MIFDTRPLPRWTPSFGNRKLATSAPAIPTRMSPMMPKPVPRTIFPASHPATSPTNKITRMLSLDIRMRPTPRRSHLARRRYRELLEVTTGFSLYATAVAPSSTERKLISGTQALRAGQTSALGGRRYTRWSCECRHPLVKIGGALKACADSQQHRLLERAANQLHADGKASARESGRDRERRQAEIIYRARKPGQPLDNGFRIRASTDVALDDGRSGDRRHGRDHGVDARDGGVMRSQRRTAPAHRFNIGDRRNRKPVLQPHQNLRAVILRPFDQPTLVKCGGFDGENKLTCRG